MIEQLLYVLIIVVAVGFSMVIALEEDRMPYWVAVFVGVATILIFSLFIAFILAIFFGLTFS